jgi:hypothetical protein
VSDWPHVKDAVTRVVDGVGFSNEDLREVAEELKFGDKDGYTNFVQLFGVGRIYPEIKT